MLKMRRKATIKGNDMRTLVSITNDGQLIYGGMADSIDIKCSARISNILFTETDIISVAFHGNPIGVKETKVAMCGNVIPNYIALLVEDK
jgi:hypothetical protein